MAVLPIVQYPDDVLRAQAQRVTEFDDDLARLAADMIETMHEAPGVGLAAPQVDVSRRLIVVDPDAGGDDTEVRILVNPEILEAEGREADQEGCLSIPDFTDKVNRATRIHVRAQTLEGETYELEAEDFLARVIQHEVDHLDGILFIDRLRGLRRERGRRHLKKLMAAAKLSSR